MRNINLENKKIDYNALEKYGFILNNGEYIYKKDIINDKFRIIVRVINNEMISKLIDNSFNEEYVMVDVKDATGKFVGRVKEEYDNIIDDIINSCTINDVFKSKQAKEVIKYIEKKYNNNLEFLWEKFKDVAIWRNNNNNKWYGLIMTITEEKLGINSNKKIETIGLRYPKDQINEVIDNKKVFPGYHMNKKIG